MAMMSPTCIKKSLYINTILNIFKSVLRRFRNLYYWGLTHSIKWRASLWTPWRIFDYCSVVWDGLSRQLSEKLQKLQNRAVRVITKSSYNTNSSYLLNSLSWDNLSVRRTKQKANLMYKYANKLAPNYLCNMFTPRALSFDLRDASQKL